MKRREHSRLLSTSLSVQGPRSKVSILPTNVRPEALEPPTERDAPTGFTADQDDADREGIDASCR